MAEGSGPASQRCFQSGTAVPAARGPSLHLSLAVEGMDILGVLADFSFLHHFLEEGASAGLVFLKEADLAALAMELCDLVSRLQVIWSFYGRVPPCLPS